MTRLAFLSPHESPAYADADVLGKLEVRGGVPTGAIALGPDRALVLVDGDVRPTRDRLLDEGYRVYDVTSGLVALEVEGEALMRRLTELDLARLPAVGAVARGTPAVIERVDGERFRVFVPQELARYVEDVVSDLAEGLR